MIEITTAILRSGLPPVPPTMRQLPIDAHTGLPVPVFVEWFNGKPDFRVSSAVALRTASKHRRCMICGHALDRTAVFAMPPINALNQSNDEPPMHRECAEWSARVCPWMTRPSKLRRETGQNLPTLVSENPSVQYHTESPPAWALYEVADWTWHDQGDGFLIFQFDAPASLAWWTQGGPARHDVVSDALQAAYLRQLDHTLALPSIYQPASLALLDQNMRTICQWLPEAE